MMKLLRALVSAVAWIVVLSVALSAIALIYLMNTGLSARPAPGATETAVARAIRGIVTSQQARSLQNPIARTPDAVAAGLAHFADHCASCHANDGSGNTAIGRGLFPRPPDMRSPETQQLSDGELFYIIEHGVRFTGMPAFGSDDGSSAEGSWQLVHFIRHLPALTAAEIEEMEGLNPAPPEEIRQQIEAERFLQGDSVPPPPAPPAAPHHPPK
jgi:mono/diheme cytochrome c family protein